MDLEGYLTALVPSFRGPGTISFPAIADGDTSAYAEAEITSNVDTYIYAMWIDGPNAADFAQNSQDAGVIAPFNDIDGYDQPSEWAWPFGWTFTPTTPGSGLEMAIFNLAADSNLYQCVLLASS